MLRWQKRRPLSGAWSQPVMEVRPGDLVSATSGHNSNMASGGAEEFFIFAAHLRQDRFRLAWRGNVVSFRDHCKQIRADAAKVHPFAANHPLTPHQPVVPV